MHTLIIHHYSKPEEKTLLSRKDQERRRFRSVPITLLANDALLSVASPRSPILTDPVGPVMNMLSHLRSLWMIGGARVWRKWRPLRICLHQLRSTLIFITLNRFRYLEDNKLFSHKI